MQSDEAPAPSRRDRLTRWERAFNAHWGHRSFRTHDWAFSREYGFSCDCCGEETEWRVDVCTLRMMLPEARNVFLRARNADIVRDRREARKANIKAKALLHYNLTKAQRWELRATRAFTITGKDGRTYRITEGSASNVLVLENGIATHRLCVVAKNLQLPVYDLMLAQKLMLESNPEGFWKIAVVTELGSEDIAWREAV